MSSNDGIRAQESDEVRRERARKHLAAYMGSDAADRARDRVEDECNATISPALGGMLELAVPMWIERFRKLSDAEFEALREPTVDRQCGQDSAALADPETKRKPGTSASAFNTTAKTLAMLAFQRGGVTWCGYHWDASVRPLHLGFNLDSIAEDVV